MATLLRQWLDQAGMRVADVHSNLTPEHFADGRIPGRSTVADRLAGLGLRQDFVEAMADICSPNAAARTRLLEEVADARRRTRAVSDHRGRAVSADAQLVLVQQRSIEISDKLLRALERAAQLERERNDANQMVLVLLAMLDKVHRDIATLGREHDRLRTSRSAETELQQVRERLAKSERRRATAETELERARAERQLADQLAEEAAGQVRRLTDELEQLRGQVPGSSPTPEPAVVAPVLQDVLDEGGADLDVGLAKAARYLDDSADRLDQLASELRLDNPPDNLLTSNDTADNSPDNPQMPHGDDVGLTSEQVVTGVRALVKEGGTQERVESLLHRAAQAQSVPQVLETAVRLRETLLHDEAAQLLSLAIHRTLPAEMPMLVSSLHSQEQDAELYRLLTQVARHWSAAQIVEAVTCLREAAQDAEAYQVLSAVGRNCPPVEVLKILVRLNQQDADWVLDAACRDRPVDELPDLQAALSNLRSADASKVAMAYSQRKERAAAQRPLPATAPGRNSDGDLNDEGVLLRPFAMSGGDGRRQRYRLPPDALVRTTAQAHEFTGLLPEHQRFLHLCREPHEVKAVAELLSIPVGVARIITADLLEAGLLVLHPTTASAWLNKSEGIKVPTEAIGSTLTVGFGWQIPRGSHLNLDLDACAIGVKGGRIYSIEYFVFFNYLHAPDNAIIHTGSNQGREGDQETILVNLDALPPDLEKIVFPVSIYDAEDLGQSFSQVSDAYIRIIAPGHREIARYNFAEKTSDASAVILGELYRSHEEWWFRTVGQTYTSGLLEIAERFSINV